MIEKAMSDTPKASTTIANKRRTTYAPIPSLAFPSNPDLTCSLQGVLIWILARQLAATNQSFILSISVARMMQMGGCMNQEDVNDLTPADRGIIALLQVDGRMPFSAMAAQL